MAVLFYAGHGVQIDGQNYLLPIDVKTDVADFRSDLMDVGTILAGLDDRLRANIDVVLDACRDNPMAKTAAQAETGGRSISVRSGLASPTTIGKGRRPAPERSWRLPRHRVRWRSMARDQVAVFDRFGPSSIRQDLKCSRC